MAAEILLGVRVGCEDVHRFNEAAANGRGNRDAGDDERDRPADASMRPRRMAAEIAMWRASVHVLAAVPLQ